MAVSSKATAAWIDVAERAGQSEHRYVEMSLAVHNFDGSEILVVGGKWDTVDRVYVDTDDAIDTIDATLLEQGEPAFAAFAQWLEANVIYRAAMKRGESNREAKRLAWGDWKPLYAIHLHGGRRASKSWTATMATLSAAIAIPNMLIAMVSATRDRTRELRDLIEKTLPDHWYQWRSADHLYRLVNGTTMAMHTARTADLKVGQVDLVLLNEAQLISHTISMDARGGLADRSGLCLLAYNPPRTAIGTWVRDEYEEIAAGRYRHGERYAFDPENNPYIDIEALHSLPMSEQARNREIKGKMDTPIGDVVFPMFSEDGNVLAAIPPSWEDITLTETAIRTGVSRAWVGGLDFDRGAGCSHAEGKLYAVPGRADVVLVWHNGITEHEYAEWQLDERLQEIRDEHGAKYLRENRAGIVWVADASGLNQNTDRNEAKPESIPMLRVKGWKVVLPQRYAEINPRAEVRFDLCKRLIRKRRVYFLASASFLVGAVRDYPTIKQTGEPKRRHPLAHVNDAWMYPTFRMFAPRPHEQRSGAPEFRDRAPESMPI